MRCEMGYGCSREATHMVTFKWSGRMVPCCDKCLPGKRDAMLPEGLREHWATRVEDGFGGWESLAYKVVAFRSTDKVE